MAWQHYDLEKKWAGSAALVYGVPTMLVTQEIHDLFFEPDVDECSISIWPIGEASEGTTPCLLGTEDLYAICANGKNRNKKFLPYRLMELRGEQAGWRPSSCLGDSFTACGGGPDGCVERSADRAKRGWVSTNRWQRIFAAPLSTQGFSDGSSTQSAATPCWRPPGRTSMWLYQYGEL